MAHSKSGRLSVLLSLVSLAAACAPTGDIRYETESQAKVTADGLHRIKAPAGVGAAVFVKPGADLREYRQLLLDPVKIRYRRAPEGRLLDAKKMALLERYFREALEGELRKTSGYSMTSQPGPDVLRVSADIVDLEVTAPEQPIQNDTTFVQSGGQMTLLLELSDSLSKEALLRAAERRAVQNPSGSMYATSATSNLAGARLRFRHWSVLLRQWLERVHEIPPLEVAPSN